MAKQPTARNEPKAKSVVQKKLKTLEKLIATGIDSREKLQQMTALEMSQLPGAGSDNIMIQSHGRSN